MGYREKRQLKQDLANLIIDKKSYGKVHSDQKAEILGMLAYFKSIEPKYAAHVEKKLLQKFNINHHTIRNYLKS